MAGFWGVSRAIEPLDSNGLIKLMYYLEKLTVSSSVNLCS